MKVYVIGKYEEKARVKSAMSLLKENGHEITCDWTEGEDATNLAGAERLACLRRSAHADREGVQAAEAVIVLHHDQLCGGLVEFGLALADPTKLLLVVGAPRPTARRQPIFYWEAPVRFFPTVEDATDFLRECELNGWR